MHALSHVTIDRCHVTALLGSCDSRVVSLLVRAQSVQTVMAEGEEEGERERAVGGGGRRERERAVGGGGRKGGMGGRRKEV